MEFEAAVVAGLVSGLWRDLHCGADTHVGSQLFSQRDVVKHVLYILPMQTNYHSLLDQIRVIAPRLVHNPLHRPLVRIPALQQIHILTDARILFREPGHAPLRRLERVDH